MRPNPSISLLARCLAWCLATFCAAVSFAQAPPPPELRTQADAELVGKPVGRISFGCDLKICENPANNAEFVDIAGLRVGQMYSGALVETAETRLAKTGFFDALVVTKELVDGAVFIDIVARGSTLIRDVVFEGVETPPFESELKKLLIYRQGQAYRGDKQKALTQVQSLKGLYEKEGYFGTEIDLKVRRVKDAPHLVDLVVGVKRGAARRVCEVGMRGVTSMPYAEARELLLSEGSFFSRRLQLVDTTYTTRGFKDGQQSLIEAYRRRGHFQARIVDKGVQFAKNGTCVTLLVDVNEGPRWQLSFVGNKRFTGEELTENLPFYESGYVDAEEIRRAERAMEKLYETRGHPFARVTGTETKRDDLDRTLEFNVVEGPQLEIREISFSGIKAFSADELLAVMSTRVFALFDVGGYLQSDELLGDFTRIEALYRERGYHSAQIEKFALKILGDGAMAVDVWIEEGTPTLISRVDVDGNRKTTDGELLVQLQAVSGKPFVPMNLRADQTRMLQRYSRLGYPLAKVQSQCFLLSGEEVLCEAPRMPRGCVARLVEELEGRCAWSEDRRTYTCDRVSDATECVYGGGVTSEAIRLRHALVEGPQVTVGARLLKGNFETRASVIHREIELSRGDLLDTQRLIQGQGNLRQLNVFDSVSVETIGLDEVAAESDTAVTALLINVEEASTSYVDFTSGLELREPFVDSRQLLLTGEVQYTNRNLFGLAQGIQPRMIGAFDTLQLAETSGVVASDPTSVAIDSLDYVFGGEVLYSHPRFLKEQLGINKLNFTVGPFYLLDLLGIVNRQVLREEWGLRSEFRKDLSELMDRLFFKLGLEFKQIATFGADGQIRDGERVFSPRRTVGKLEPDFSLDRRDSPLNPKTGYLLRLEPTFVSGDALGKGGEGFFSDAFLRLQLGASHFVPLWRGELVFGQGIRAGQAIPLASRDTPIPLEERFFLGGVRSVRGFEDDTLGPVSSTQAPTGGEFFLNYNAELRYPLIRRFSVFGATFFDAGVLSDCFGNFGVRDCYGDAFSEGLLSDVRAAAGLGFRALILEQIPIVFDYGIVLNRRPGERFGQLHLNVGYTFD